MSIERHQNIVETIGANDVKIFEAVIVGMGREQRENIVIYAEGGPEFAVLFDSMSIKSTLTLGSYFGMRLITDSA